MLQGFCASVSSLHYLELFVHVPEHPFIERPAHGACACIHCVLGMIWKAHDNDNDIRILPVVNLGSLDLSADVLKSLNSVLMMMSAH